MDSERSVYHEIFEYIYLIFIANKRISIYTHLERICISRLVYLFCMYRVNHIT